MPTYCAKYKTKAGMYDAGQFMPDPEPRYDEYQFRAKDDKEARTLAENHKGAIGTKYFGVESIALESLLQVRDVKRERK